MNTDESTEVVSQPPPEVEEGQGAPGNDYSAFLGPPSPEADLAETPAPGEQEPEGEEQRLEGEPEREAPAQPEAQAEPEAEQPPSIEERLQDLTQRELNEYANRYPSAWKALNDARTPEDIKHLLLDKIDSDHEIQRRIAQEQALAEQEYEEPTPEYQPESPQQVQQTPETVAQQRTAYYQNIDNLVSSRFDQQSIQELGGALLRMFNVRTEALQDPNISPQDKAILQDLVTSVQREAPVLARYMADAVTTVVPHILKPALDVAMPGFTDQYERNMYAQAYESVRQQVDERGRPLYPDLPAYPAVRGTPEAREFSQLMREASSAIPGFDDMVFQDAYGRVLPQQQQAALKYQMLARHLAGQRVNPQVVAEAVETGRRLAGRANTTRQTARITGAGRGTQAGLPAGGAEEEEDPLLAALDAQIAREEHGYRQVIRGRQSGR